MKMAKHNAIGHLTMEEISPGLLEDIREIAIEEAGNEQAETTAFNGSKYGAGHIMHQVDDVQEAIDKLTDIVDNTATSTEDGLMGKKDKEKLDKLNLNNDEEGDFLWSADRILQEIAKLRVVKTIIELTVETPDQKTFELGDIDTRTSSIEVRVGGVPFSEKRYRIEGNQLILNPEDIGIAQGRSFVVVVHSISK